MPCIQPKIPDAATEYMINSWMTGEVCRYYVEMRQRFCTYFELLDLFFSAPLCEDCKYSDSFPPYGPSDISPGSWKTDIQWLIGKDVLAIVRKERKKDPSWGFPCKRCSTTLRPWEGDDVYVVSYHVEDHYRFPLIRPRQVNPSRIIQKQIKDLYGNRCFHCKRKQSLHIDHINLRSNGGNGAFRNLQPLFFPKNTQHDAYVEIRSIIQAAKRSITVIDGYLDSSIFTLLAGAQTTKRRIRLLTSRTPTDFVQEAKKFLAQYHVSLLEIRKTVEFHDRFLIVDETHCWHIGCSIKSAGSKTFMMSKLEDGGNRNALLCQLNKSWSNATLVRV